MSSEDRKQIENVYDVIENSVPADALGAVHQLLYGGAPVHGDIPDSAKALSEKEDFEIRSYVIPCKEEQRRAPRRVKIAAIQNHIYAPTTAPVHDQYKAIEAKIEVMLDAAAASGANIAVLQEAWTCPFFFCTREKYPWLELAEDATTGESVKFVQRKAKELNMVIVTSILEIDEKHADTIWNTCVVVSNNGGIIGKTRKYHIPRVGDFNESTYYFESQDPVQPVFETAFGRIGVSICYSRHFPQAWQCLALNGAEIILNPSATTDGLSEPLWSIEARNAAIANSVFTVGINRVGSETFPNEFTSGDGKPAHKTFGHFYGSSYVTGPTGQRTPALSRTRSGVLISDIDLNQCRQIRNTWNFHMCARWADYAKFYNEQIKPDYKLPIIRDPSLPAPKKDE